MSTSTVWPWLSNHQRSARAARSPEFPIVLAWHERTDQDAAGSFVRPLVIDALEQPA